MKLLIKLAKVLRLKKGNYYRKKKWSDSARRIRDDRARSVLTRKKSMLDIATERMMHDIYGLAYASILKDTCTYEQCYKKIKGLIVAIGSYNIYQDRYSGETWLVRFKYSMPASKFIIHLKGYEAYNPYAIRVVEEWSGLTDSEIATVYRRLTIFFWQELDKERRGLDSLLSRKAKNIKSEGGAVLRDDLCF